MTRLGEEEGWVMVRAVEKEKDYPKWKTGGVKEKETPTSMTPTVLRTNVCTYTTDISLSGPK